MLLLHKWLRQAGVGCEKLALLMTHTLDRCSTPQLQTLQYRIALYMSTCHSFLHKSGCLPKQDALNDAPFAGVLGSMLTDDEAGRVKLTRVAINVGKVPILVSVLLAQQQQLHLAAFLQQRHLELFLLHEVIQSLLFWMLFASQHCLLL